MGIREKETFENKVIYIGNIYVENKTTSIVSMNFSFKNVENTLAELFNIC